MLAAAVAAAQGWGLAAGHDPHDGRRLVWNDEFDGADLDVTKWSFRQTMTTQDAVYDNGPRTVRVEDGVLKLMVGRSGNAAKPWLLPQGVTTADGMSFKYGYLEMRARLPCRDGAWSGFWTQTTESLRKANYMAEVDIFEFVTENSLGSTFHKWGLTAPRQHDKGTDGGSYAFDRNDDLSNEFHVYGFEWSPSEMSFYVDGNRYWTRAIDNAHDFGSALPGMEGFHDYMFVILNNEIFTSSSTAVMYGGLAALPDDTPLPVNYWVDWVRLYQNPNDEYLCLKTNDRQMVRHSPGTAWSEGGNPAADSQGATWAASRREKANDPIASGALLAKKVQTDRKTGFAANDSSGAEIFVVRGTDAYEEGGCVFSPGEIVFKPTSRGYGNWRVALTFEVPCNGWYAMSARFRAADTTVAGRVDTSVLVGGQVLQQEELVRSGNGQPCWGYACTFAHKFLSKGTQIEFVVGPEWQDSTSDTWWNGHLNDATALTLSIVEEKGLGDETRLSVADLGRAIGGLTEQTSGSTGTFPDESGLGTWSLCQFDRTQAFVDETVRKPLSRVSANDVGTRGVAFRSSVSDADDPQVKINGGERAGELSVTERKWACPYDTVAPGEVLVNPSDGQCVGIRFVPEQAGGYVVSVKARDLAMSQDTGGTWGHSGVDVTLAVNGRGLASSRVSAELQSVSGCYQWMFAQTDVLPLQKGDHVDLVIDPRDSAARDATGLSVQVFKVRSSVVGLPTAYAMRVDVPVGETVRMDGTFADALGTMDMEKTGPGVLRSSSAMAGYVGNITVEEGTLMTSGSGDLGTTSCVDVRGAHVVMSPAEDESVWGHGGMMIGYRADGGIGYFGPERQDVSWTYCADGPGPQLGLVNWPKRNPETFCSRGYIWNREVTNVTYKVFVGVPYQNYVYLDGVNVYNNKRDNWDGTYAMTLTPGPHSIDIITVAYGTDGPRSDSDKPHLNGELMRDPGNGYLFTTDTVSRAEVLLEIPCRNANFTFGGNSILDANGRPIEMTDLSGFVTVENATSCKIEGTWTIRAADIGKELLTVTGDRPLTFDNVTIAVDDVNAIPQTQRHWDLCAAESIAGFPAGAVLEGTDCIWKLVMSPDGKTAGIEWHAKGMTFIVR